MHARRLKVLITFLATFIAGIVLATPAAGFGGETPPVGDGGTLECPLTVTEESAAQSECTYQYTRSSANQPNNTYTGQASTLWEATWTVPEFGISGTIDAPRETDFELQVAEVQTINR